jgi:hypothetical protein
MGASRAKSYHGVDAPDGWKMATIRFTTRSYVAKETIRFRVGGVAERFKAAVLKTAGRESRGFESLLLR